MNIIFILIYFFLPRYVFAYQPLVSNSPLTSAAQSQNLNDFLIIVFNWGIGIAVALAILFIIFGGIQYMTTDAIFKKEEGKKRITAAVVGLLIALSGWLILNQINPDILKSDLTLKPINVDSTVPGVGGGGTQTPGGGSQPGGNGNNNPPGTGDIVPIPEGIPVKPGAGTNVNSAISNKLVNLNSSLTSSGISWRVTEGYPPTRSHLSSCHQNGTCVDANFTGNTSASASNITTFINAADSAGLRAVYEVSSESQKQNLINQGVPSSNIIVYSGITAPHFSVYNR